MFQGQAIQLRPLESGIVELCFDRIGDAINKLDVSTVNELSAAIDKLYAKPDLRGVLISSAKKGFIVGADVFEFSALFAQSAPSIVAHLASQNAVFQRLEDIPVPTVTAINGIALGGGFELALLSNYRVIDGEARVGLPEVNLGLFPGLGGTVRLPRLAGASVAIEWIANGGAHAAEQARSDGVVDAVVKSCDLRRAALHLLDDSSESGTWRQTRRQRRGPFKADAAVFEQAKGRLKKHFPRLPAALAAVELMQTCSGLASDEALILEHNEFARIARTQAASALVQLFVSQQQVKSKYRSLGKQGREVKAIGVLGAGIMGRGIALSAAANGVRTLVKDVAIEPLQRGMSEVRKLLDRAVEAGRMTEVAAHAAYASIHPQVDYRDFESLDLVIEAVSESEPIKQQVLQELTTRVRKDVIIASNTSSLSITGLASCIGRPENFVGMHFFNPVPLMPLVEIIRGSQTGAATAAAAARFVSALGKTPIVVKDCPGFLVNRILVAYFVGYFRTLRDGADFMQVDRVMEDFGWSMGPAYLQDVVGMDTLLQGVKATTESYPERMHLDFPIPPQLLVGANRLGQKSGLGYYRYETDSTGKSHKMPDPAAQAIVASVRTIPGPPRAIGDTEIIERLMLPMIVESARCLAEGIGDSAAEIDLALVLGLGFPRHTGGALKYADWLSLRHVINRCEHYAQFDPLYEPTVEMRAMARGARRFLG